MSGIWIKKLSAAVLCVGAIQGCAQEALSVEESCCEPYLPFTVWGRFIYWQPIQENMKIGVCSRRDDAFDLVTGKVKDISETYQPGFQVGAKYFFPCDYWDTSLEYTWLRSDQKVHVNLEGSEGARLYPAWQLPSFLNPQYAVGREKWNLDLDILDWNFGRTVCFGSYASFRPYFGVRGARIRQQVVVEYRNTTINDEYIWPSTLIRQHSKSWGVGPQVGIQEEWGFGCGFKVFAEQEFDVLYSWYDLKSKQESEEDAPNRFITDQPSAKYLRAHVDLSVGLGWGTSFCEDSYRIDLLAAYHFQIFFDQNTFRNTLNVYSAGNSIMPNGNLYIPGFTATLSFAF